MKGAEQDPRLFLSTGGTRINLLVKKPRISVTKKEADAVKRGVKVAKLIPPGRLTWNLQITHLERKIIFQTSMIMFHVHLQGCSNSIPSTYKSTSRI